MKPLYPFLRGQHSTSRDQEATLTQSGISNIQATSQALVVIAQLWRIRLRIEQYTMNSSWDSDSYESRIW